MLAFWPGCRSKGGTAGGCHSCVAQKCVHAFGACRFMPCRDQRCIALAGDVGIGLNVRRMRRQFLGQFIVTYSIRPIGDEGTVFRRYPAEWKVFLEDKAEPGRYKLAAERSERPDSDVLERIIASVGKGQSPDSEESQGGGLLQSVANSVNSMSRFMQSLTK